MGINTSGNINNDFVIDTSIDPDNPKFIIKSSGNVGIGTASPSSPLQVNTFKDVTLVKVTCTNGETTISLSEDLTSVLSAGNVIRFNNSGGGDLSTKEYEIESITDSLLTLTEALNFTAALHISKILPTLNVKSGNVGVGIDSPISTLHVKSSLDGPIFDSGGTDNANHAFLVRDNSNNQLLRVENNGNVGIGTTTPSAPLEISSTSGGLILPRMTASQKNAITSPTRGEMVFDDTDNTFYGYNGTSWVALH